jgi:8-oxo-dGTP pyrophosphatase MutT (NUDIX family)
MAGPLLSDEEYAKQLPKKTVGSAVLFFNEANELLVVKPNYKEGWLVVGGAVDENESPLTGALREVSEEIALSLTSDDVRLVGVYYGHQRGFFADTLKFIYYGGILSSEQIEKLVLQTEELDEMRFVSPEEALTLLTNSMRKSLMPSIEAIPSGTVAYIEG